MDYYEAYQKKERMQDVRQQMVKYAMEYGIKPAARAFGTNVKTVKRWVRHFRESSHVDVRRIEET